MHSSFIYSYSVASCQITKSHPSSYLSSYFCLSARSVDVDTIIESIFSTTGDARLPQPVPLSQMIDLLVDFWEVRDKEEDKGVGERGEERKGRHQSFKFYYECTGSSLRSILPLNFSHRRTGFTTKEEKRRRKRGGRHAGAGRRVSDTISIEKL